MVGGYELAPIDASQALVDATTPTGRAGKLLRFGGIEFQAEFDVIWACP